MFSRLLWHFELHVRDLIMLVAISFPVTFDSPLLSEIAFRAALWKQTMTFVALYRPRAWVSGVTVRVTVCCQKSSRVILATSGVNFWYSDKESFPTRCTTSCRSSSAGFL